MIALVIAHHLAVSAREGVEVFPLFERAYGVGHDPLALGSVFFTCSLRQSWQPTGRL